MFKHAQKDDELAHYGITGQKWGKRRWQYADGRFNPEGKERYFGSKSKKEKSSDTGVKDYIKYKNESSDQKQKFGGHIENNDISDEANKIYKKYKPNEWRRVLNTSDDLSTEDKIKLENELNKKLYKEDKHYARIVNNENVKNALREYIDSWNDVIKESNRIYSKEFMDNNPEAKDWSGDGTEYWYKFADKDISNRDKESYWKLREMVSSLSRKHGSWNNEIFDKVMSDLTEPVEDITDDSSKAYDKIKEHIGVDFREPNQKFGSIDSKEAKKLTKEAKKLEKEFTTTSKYDSSYKYFDSDKIEKWLDKEENKAVEKAYADAMETAFGDTSKELHKLFKDYDDNENEYVAKAAICDSLDYYDNLGDISSEIRWFMGDDGDQGSRNSHAYYLNEKGYNAKQINDKLADAEKALNEGYEVGKKLSQYYNPVILHMPDDLQKKVYNNIHYRWEKSDDYSFNKLLNAHEGLDFDKNNMKTADNFAKKLQPSCGNDFSGWMYLNKAIDNLNMGDISYKDLTDADWNRINAEVNKLKK